MRLPKRTTLPAKPAHVLMVAGGTGGHVFPALAIAAACLKMGAQVSWLGCGTMETPHVKKLGVRLFVVPSRSPRRRRIGDWLRLFFAIVQAVWVVAKVRPSVVLGMGGYPSVAGGVAAWLCRKRLVIHEQNAVMGRANRLLHQYCASQTVTAFTGVSERAVVLGNPVRHEFSMPQSAAATASEDKSKKQWRFLILGGSQGAAALNKTIPAGLALLAQQGYRVQVIHQCGKTHRDVVAAAYAEADANIAADVIEFIDDVATKMRAVDLVICRAGASTLAELAAVGAAALLIPYPHAAGDHQLLNAQYFARHDAAVLCEESQLTPAALVLQLAALNHARIQTLRQNCRRLARPHAAREIAQLLVQGGARAA